MKRTLTIQRSVDCNNFTCGKCQQRNGALCCEFGAQLLKLSKWNGKLVHERCRDCLIAEGRIAEPSSVPLAPTRRAPV